MCWNPNLLSIPTNIVLVASCIIPHLNYCKSLLSGLCPVLVSPSIGHTTGTINFLNTDGMLKNKNSPWRRHEGLNLPSQFLPLSTLSFLLYPPARKWASNALFALNYHKFLNMLCTLKCLSSGGKTTFWRPPTRATKLSSNYISSVKFQKPILVKTLPHPLLYFVFC